MLLPILYGYLVSYAATKCSKMPRNQIMEYRRYSMFKVLPIPIHVKLWYDIWTTLYVL